MTMAPAMRLSAPQRLVKAVAAGSLSVAGLLLAVQQVPTLQQRSRVLAGAATLIPFGLAGWAVGGGAVAAGTRGVAGPRGTVRKAAIASVIGCGLVHAAGLVNRFGGRRTDAGASQLRIVMLNVEYGRADTAALLAKARDTDADVVVIVEYHPRTEAELAELGHEYRYRIGRPTLDAEGTVVLSRTPLVQQAYVGEIFDNYVVTTTVRDVAWTIAAVHPYPPVRSASEWVEDSRRVADMVRPFVGDNLLVIGDFNATLDQVTMGEFTDMGLRNAALQTGSGWVSTWPMEYPVPAFAALDHALTSPSVVANRFETFAVPGSDHKGLAVVASVRG